MTEFEPITTQEDLDKVIKDRLSRERATIEKRYSDYDDLKSKVAGFETEKTNYENNLKKKNDEIADLTGKLNSSNSELAKVKKEKMQTSIALEFGLPAQLSARLSGETEEDIRKDAELLQKLFKDNQQKGLPLAGNEGKSYGAEAEKREALKNVLAKITKKGE